MERDSQNRGNNGTALIGLFGVEKAAGAVLKVGIALDDLQLTGGGRGRPSELNLVYESRLLRSDFSRL